MTRAQHAREKARERVLELVRTGTATARAPAADGARPAAERRRPFMGMRSGSIATRAGERLGLLQAGFTSRQLERMSWARMRRLVALAEMAGRAGRTRGAASPDPRSRALGLERPPATAARARPSSAP